MSGNKITVGVLGATGMVGQRYIYLLKDHPLWQPHLDLQERNTERQWLLAGLLEAIFLPVWPT